MRIRAKRNVRLKKSEHSERLIIRENYFPNSTELPLTYNLRVKPKRNVRLNVTKFQTPQLHNQVKTPEPGNSLNSLCSGLNISKSILKVKKKNVQNELD